jgi:hypothetical protein
MSHCSPVNNSDNLTGYIYFFFIKQRHIFIHTNTQVYIYKINMIGTRRKKSEKKTLQVTCE